MAKSLDDKLDINEIRRDIDRVDNQLLSLIARRLDLAGKVRQAKSGVRIWRPSREESLVRDLAAAAGDTPPGLVSRVWSELMSASLALQGAMQLHVALEGDVQHVWTMVRDRFGAALPIRSYPTASTALAAAYADPEGVAIVPAPGGIHGWWSSLCEGGAMPDMAILAGLPRIGDYDWPPAVAVACGEMVPSGDDVTLIAAAQVEALKNAGFIPTIRDEQGDFTLVSVDGYVAPDDKRLSLDAERPDKVVGVIARPLSA